MGAGASTDLPSFDDIGRWSKEEVGEEVAGLGKAFEEYKEVAIENDVDGAMVVSLSDKDLEEIGVKGIHRKKILAKIGAAKESGKDAPAKAASNGAASCAAPRGQTKLFLSYPRGDLTTPFARALKASLVAAGCEVWMDEEGIAGGVDFMSAIGSAIMDSDGIVAVIDEKFCGSTYCNNEVAMAQGHGLQLFPILFRGMSFDRLPPGLQYMLASINCIAFENAADDEEGMGKMCAHVAEIFQGGDGSKPLMRHGDTSAAPLPAAAVAAVTPAAAAPPADELAAVPATVPELPDVMSERPEMASELRGHLLGFMASGSVSLSSVKSKVATHGQGGVGKTTMAAAMVNDAMVRRAFVKIGWVSVGQAPDIMELQRSLFEQLAGEPMLRKDGATPADQLSHLQGACKGKRWLVVLDDVWDRAHEKLLNCVDDKSPSKLLVTTRIRGLLAGCDELSLNLMTPQESVDLLLRTGAVEDPEDAVAAAAAAQVAGLCGHLPLYLSICGSIISDYEGGAEWQEELVQMLQEDRVGVIDEAAGDENAGMTTAGRIVDASLNMLKDADASAAFMSLGTAPEDVLVPIPVAQLLCAADAANTSKSTTITVRKSVKKLLDRNLLQGSTTEGFQMHDIVRDLVRSRIGDADAMRAKQRAVVAAFIEACPEGARGWAAGDATGVYASQALRVHMAEALPLDAAARLDAEEALAWLDASDNVMGHIVVRCAAQALGHPAVLALGERSEAAGQPWTAAKRFGAAAITMIEQSGTRDHEEAQEKETPLLQRACLLLAGMPEQTRASRTLELSLRGQVAMRLKWDNPFIVAGQTRIQELLEEGIDVDDAALLVGAGWAQELSNMSTCGFNIDGEEHTHDPAQWKLSLDRGFMSAHYKTALDLLPRADPYWIVAAAYITFACSCPGHRQQEIGVATYSAFCPHALLVDLMDSYDFNKHTPLLQAAPMGMDFMLASPQVAFALGAHGDIAVCRRWFTKMCECFEGMDARTQPGAFIGACMGGLNCTNSYFAKAGLGDLSLRLMKATYNTYDEVTASAEAYNGVMQFFSWTGKRHTYFTQAFSVAQMRRRHWLLAPDEVGREKMEAWLADVPAEWGSAAQGELLETTPTSIGMLMGGDCAEVFESLGRYEEGIVAAQADVRSSNCVPPVLIASHCAMGRCHAALQRPAEARAAFEAAVAEARRCELPFFEMLAHRDLIVHVLDAEDAAEGAAGGVREAHMATLGACIGRLVGPLEEYSAVLGTGIDAEAAVAAAKSSSA
jgi:hypothetical protein